MYMYIYIHLLATMRSHSVLSLSRHAIEGTPFLSREIFPDRFPPFKGSEISPLLREVKYHPVNGQ